MGETLVNNLGGILTGAALFVTAVGTLLNIWFTHRTRVAVADVDKKVDDGAKETRQALTEIAKTAVAASSNRSVRATDRKAEP
jgi:hypothetical protein